MSISADPRRAGPHVSGETLRAGAPGYDEARAVWNARFDRRPEVIVRAAAPGDIVAALKYAREHDLAVSVKGGGHAYAGNSVLDGGLLIDLGPMNQVSVDADLRRATVGAGARWGAVDEATQAVGLATPGGTVSTVGVAGLTLGGGEGWLSRVHGLACDNLVGADVVTASGAMVRASDTENPDLFWGLRGGSGNLGIVTSFEFALHSLDHQILAGQVIHPFDRAPELLRSYRDYFEDAVDEAVCFPFVYRVPPLDVFPAECHGEIVLALVMAFMGPLADGERHLAPLRALAAPILDGVAPHTYVGLQQSFDAGMGNGNRWYSRAHFLDTLSDEAIDILVDRVDPLPGEFTTVYLGPGGGAVGRKRPDATAFPHRTSAHQLHIFPGWIDADRDEEIMAWTRRISDAVVPCSSGGVYVNLLGEDERSRVPAAYGSNYERLTRLKTKWDPDNRFRSNHNIPPRP
jgi:FAD/FMN-containing dehydrogenase